PAHGRQAHQRLRRAWPSYTRGHSESRPSRVCVLSIRRAPHHPWRCPQSVGSRPPHELSAHAPALRRGIPYRTLPQWRENTFKNADLIRSFPPPARESREWVSGFGNPLLWVADCYRIACVMDTRTVLDRLPTPSEHRRLAEAVGWAHAFDWETMPASLEGSLAGVVAIDGRNVVGMGRLVGDGVKYFYVQDLAVLPAYQGQGIGTALLRRLLDHVARPEDGFCHEGCTKTRTTERATKSMPKTINTAPATRRKRRSNAPVPTLEILATLAPKP